MRGVTVEHDLTKTAIAQVHLLYKGRAPTPPGLDHFEIECEVYEVGGILAVHSVCPKCRHSQWIDGRNKSIRFDRDTGKLFIEPFTCPWEMTAERHEFGIGLCRLRVAYDGKAIKDA